MGKAIPGSAYGAAGSLVAMVIWIYYSAQIFFFGAEFTRVYALTQRKDLADRTTQLAAPSSEEISSGSFTATSSGARKV
jgi:membrane protein